MSFVYLTTNLINGKQYIGSTNGKKKHYLGSGTLILKAQNKYAKENFKREILHECEDIKEARHLEEHYIKKYNTLDPVGYNLSPKGGLGDYGCHSESTKQKIGKSNKGKIRSEETKKLMSESAKKRKVESNYKGLSEKEAQYALYMHLVCKKNIGKIAKKLGIHHSRVKRYMEKNYKVISRIEYL